MKDPAWFGTIFLFCSHLHTLTSSTADASPPFSVIPAQGRDPFRQRLSTARRRKVGVHLGDVIIEGEDILGDGVNVAARIEAWLNPMGSRFSMMRTARSGTG